MRFILDTHVLIWWCIGSNKLSRRYADLLSSSASPSSPLALSGISLWEIAKLVERGRLKTPIAVDVLLERLEKHPTLVVLPLSASIVLRSTRMGASYPHDPADQIIGATALCHGLQLLTEDTGIRRSGLVPVV